jgi:hypothetical protein
MSFTPRFWSTIASLIAGHFRFAKPPVAAEFELRTEYGNLGTGLFNSQWPGPS